MRQVSRCTITVILEQEHFQSFPERWQWNIQQTEVSWKTVPHDWPVYGKTTVSVVCPRTWNSELTGLSRAQVTPTAAWWRWLAVCRQVWRSHAVPTSVYVTKQFSSLAHFYHMTMFIHDCNATFTNHHCVKMAKCNIGIHSPLNILVLTANCQ